MIEIWGIKIKFTPCLLVFLTVYISAKAEEQTINEASLCEVCKFLTIELKDRLEVTGRSKEVLRIGHGLDKKGKIKYHTSELRLIEALQDPHVCDKITEYKIHAEKKGSQRYAKGRSTTMDTLHGLVNKGVKVELGMPYDMWDQPPAEVTQMQRKCYNIVEDYEDDIEEWYFHHQDTDLTQYLCQERVLGLKNSECLMEEDESEEDVSEKNLKGDSGRSKDIPVLNEKTDHKEL